MKDPANAEDVVQNVFIKIWVGRDKIDENKNFKNYLLVSVRNEIYQHFRFAAKSQHDNLSTDIIDNEINIETNLSVRELEQRIRELVQKMPQRRREIFNMSRNDKLSNLEIARRLGLSVRTVEKHIELALSDIRKGLTISVAILIMLL